MPHKNFRIKYEHLLELDAKQCGGPPWSQNWPMNHLLKMAANVAFFCHFCHFLSYVGMPWHAESMSRKPQVHWHSVEAGNTEVNLWETCIATCPNQAGLQREQNKELHLVPHMLDNKTQINYTVFTNSHFRIMVCHIDNILPVEATGWALDLIFHSNSQNSHIDLNLLTVLHP